MITSAMQVRTPNTAEYRKSVSSTTLYNIFSPPVKLRFFPPMKCIVNLKVDLSLKKLSPSLFRTERSSTGKLPGLHVLNTKQRNSFYIFATRSSRSWWYMPEDNARDEGGIYPWEQKDLQNSTGDWIADDVITFVTNEGIVQMGGQYRFMRRKYDGESGNFQTTSRLQKYREENFMDPKQQLCLGALFNIAATNGLDMGRRIYVLGFCRSVEMLSAVVEDAVLEQGGEIVLAEKQNSGLTEKLHLTVAIPLLWGVPPAVDCLNHAIRSGGGIVDKVYKQWEFL